MMILRCIKNPLKQKVLTYWNLLILLFICDNILTEDKEVDRLITDIESEIRLLTSYTGPSPRLSPGGKAMKKQHDIDTEIALQPLRSENSDLRR